MKTFCAVIAHLEGSLPCKGFESTKCDILPRRDYQTPNSAFYLPLQNTSQSDRIASFIPHQWNPTGVIFRHNYALLISLRGKTGIWPHALYAYPEEAHWYVVAVSPPSSPPFRGTVCIFFFFPRYFVWLWISSDLTAITLGSVTRHSMLSRGHWRVMCLQTG